MGVTMSLSFFPSSGHTELTSIIQDQPTRPRSNAVCVLRGWEVGSKLLQHKLKQVVHTHRKVNAGPSHTVTPHSGF